MGNARKGPDHAMFVRVHSCVGMWAKDAALSAIAQGLGVQPMLWNGRGKPDALVVGSGRSHCVNYTMRRLSLRLLHTRKTESLANHRLMHRGPSLDRMLRTRNGAEGRLQPTLPTPVTDDGAPTAAGHLNAAHGGEDWP